MTEKTISSNFIENIRNKKELTNVMRLAITHDYFKLQEILDQANAEILFQKDSKGRTALDWARMQNNQTTIHMISEAMARELNKARIYRAGFVESMEISVRTTNRQLTLALTNALNEQNGDHALKVLMDSQLSREVVEELENEIYFTDTPTIQGDTPLIRAAGYGMDEVVVELLSMGVNINQANQYGHNALTWSCLCGHAEVVRILLLRGAIFTHQTNEKRTCLHYACLYTKSRVVSVILDVLFEKFSLFRPITYPFTKFDPHRWTKYADILESFIMVRFSYFLFSIFLDQRY
jgi:ankyrin repeat protein